MLAGLQTEFVSSISDADASPQAATCLYRVLQESLMNVAKHSGSASAYVALDPQRQTTSNCVFATKGTASTSTPKPATESA